ncbi:MAG TPA: hypothetical protein VIM86_01605, partial [Thermodesulfobacteriota bacterium]
MARSPPDRRRREGRDSWVAILTGAGLIALEVRAIGLRWCVLGKGIGVAAKLAVLLLVPFFWEIRVPL